eukprot:COSAG01_NODE_3260_length_6337_cov_11.824784_2_plen_488_part_00
MRMDDAYASGPKVFVVAAKADLTPYLLRTYDISSDTGAEEGSRECAVWEAGMATSAAPTYFPAVPLRSGVQLVDGGVIANNSVQMALKEATLQIPEWMGRSIGCIVSLGCGRQKSSVRSGGTTSGQAPGALDLVKLFREAATEVERTHQLMLTELRQPKPDHPSQDSKWWWKSGPDHPDPKLRGTLYARINPKVQYHSEIEMDTKVDEELDVLQHSAESWSGFADCAHERGTVRTNAGLYARELQQKLLPKAGQPGLRILSIDGGGIKGLIPAIVIQKIEKLCGDRPVHELFDLVCGTSTGGILALGTCVAKVPVAEMIDVYRNRATDIWTKERWRMPVIGTKYDPAFLKRVLKSAGSRSTSVVMTGVPEKRDQEGNVHYQMQVWRDDGQGQKTPGSRRTGFVWEVSKKYSHFRDLSDRLKNQVDAMWGKSSWPEASSFLEELNKSFPQRTRQKNTPKVVEQRKQVRWPSTALFHVERFDCSLPPPR